MKTVYVGYFLTGITVVAVLVSVAVLGWAMGVAVDNIAHRILGH